MNKAIKFKDKDSNTLYPCPYFPIGFIYFSTSNINPSEIFGGIWERIKDKFILCAGDSYPAGSTGGSANHYHSTGNCTLSISQIPSHRHHQYWISNDGNINPYVSASGGGEGGVYYKGQTSWYNSGRAGVFTSYEGGNSSHNHGNTNSSSNIPPYMAVYVWRRIA